MIARLYRALVMGLAPIALIACVNSAPNAAGEGDVVPLRVNLGGSGPVAAAPPAADHPHPRQAGEIQMADAASSHAHASGTVNSVDPVQHKSI